VRHQLPRSAIEVYREAIRFYRGKLAIGEAAIRGGLPVLRRIPITPQNELTEYAENMRRAEGGTSSRPKARSRRQHGLGASAAGARAMTSSSSPGISLKQEGISALAQTSFPP